MIEKMKWTREPLHYEINDKMVSIMTAPHTDLWQRTYYHFRNDNGDSSLSAPYGCSNTNFSFLD